MHDCIAFGEPRWPEAQNLVYVRIYIRTQVRNCAARGKVLVGSIQTLTKKNANHRLVSFTCLQVVVFVAG